VRKVDVTDGSESRASRPFPDDLAARVHEELKRARIELPAHVTTTTIRETIREVRRQRNRVTTIVSGLSRRVGELKADSERLDRIFEAEKAWRVERNEGFVGCTNDKQRGARLESILSEELDAIAAVKQDLARAAEALSHGKLVLEELRGAFDEASRLQAGIELDWRVAHGER
jgi:chromosome segregation ATPase